LIDASLDIYHELSKHKVDPTKITHIFITHAHDDHIGGLYDLSHIYGRSVKPIIVSAQSILSEIRRKMGVSILSFKTKEIQPFEKIEIEKTASFWFIPVKHTVETYAIKIKAQKPIFYAPEFRKIRPSSRKPLGDANLAIIDGSSKTSLGQAKGHETIKEGLRLGKEIGAKKIYFTNIGHKTDTHQNLTNFVKLAGGDKFNIAYDGLTLKI
jgi:phosphoribosyl 1,2-cyclic phosphodiesterase